MLLGGPFAPAADAAQGQPSPSETADAVLIREEESWERLLHDVLELPRWVDVGVEQRTRYEALIHPFRPGEPNRQIQYPMRTRLRLGADCNCPLRFLAELQDARTHSAGPHDFTAKEIDEIDVLQLFVSASGTDLWGRGLRGDLHVGRLTMDFGSRRLIARNSFRNTTNSFDGVHAELGNADLMWRVRGFYVQPVTILQDEFDDRSSSKVRFWGVWLEDKRVSSRNLDVYYLGLRDQPGGRKYHTIGTRVSKAAKERQTDYELELNAQFGDLQNQDFGAFEGHLAVGYSFEWPGKPRVFAQFEYASGTHAPSENERHTFDPLFGARRFELIPTGIYGPFARANIMSPGVGLDLTPLRTVRAELRMRYWQLAQKKDDFVGTGLSDPTGRSGRNLGLDVELRSVWNPAGWLQFDVGLDYWFKGSYFETVPLAPTTANTYFVYAAVRFRF